MTDLERYRDEIDEIDSEIVRLFEKRMKVSEEVAEYKIKTGKQVLDPARESQKIHTLKNKAHGDFNSLGVQELFRQIMAISRKRQYQLLTEHGIYGERNFTTVKHVPLENATVVFQGVEGAYSYAAMRQYFGKNIESYHVKTWRTAMEDVTHGKADYAVLPIENSTAGIVADIYDLLMEYKLYIVGEQIIRVDHVLLGMPDAQIGDIREVCSHPQGLAQCKAIYDKNAETILGNMDSVLFLGGREASTIKEISENWLGKATISMQTEGRSRGQSESYSQNTQRLGRELMTPSELATMPGDRCILQLRGLPPFYSKKYDLKQHPNYKYTAEADKVKNAFDLNSLVTRRMDKLNPNETYTVYKVDVPDEALTGEDEDILNYDDLDDPDAFV